MAKKRWYIAFVVKEKDCSVVVTEYLRYAGAIIVGKHPSCIPFQEYQKLMVQNNELVIVVEQPREVNEVWVIHNCERLRSFGVRNISWKA